MLDKQEIKQFFSILIIISFAATAQLSPQSKLTYPIVDTGQEKFYDNYSEINAPSAGEDFYGQDAQFNGNRPSYTDNGDGTITDNVTGLMWSQTTDLNGDGKINVDDKLNYYDALVAADTLTLAGYDDWRIPSTKELYSLIMFYGLDPSGYEGTNTDNLMPFINTDYFDFAYGDTDVGERIIDAQFAASTVYEGTVMGDQTAVFGVNFADGRIKGYPIDPTPMEPDGKGFYILFVRGNSEYGVNDFSDNGDGTITDNATRLMWAQDDNGEAILWQDALTWVQEKNNENYLGYNDWRLPSVKELQSIVDYSRSPSTTNSAAIDTLFNCSTITDEGGNTNYPFYWSSTTHANMQNGNFAAYVAFGQALGWMQDPFTYEYQLMDVHGAGAQRSDPKTGDPAGYPYGHGPQGDVIRIYNYVRLVRNADQTTDINYKSDSSPTSFSLDQNYPNPFNPSTTISFSIPSGGNVSLKIFNIIGQEVGELVNKYLPAGSYSFKWNAKEQASGIYFYKLDVSGQSPITRKMVLLR
jgi:hypothetical protein